MNTLAYLRRPRLIGCLLILMALMAFGAGPSWADGVTLKLSDVPLTTALMALTQSQQAEFVVHNSSALQGKLVTVDLKDKTVDQALDLLLSSQGIPWYKDERGVYHINAKKPEPPSAPVSQEQPQPAPVPRPRYVITEKIELQSISPDEAMRALGLPVGPDSRWVRGSSPPPTLPSTLNFQPSGFLRPASPMGSGATDTTVGPIRVETQAGQLVTQPLAAEPSVGDGPAGPSDSAEGYNRAASERDAFGQAGGGARRPGFQPRPPVPSTTTGTGTTTAPGTPGTAGVAGTTATGQRGFVPEGIDLVAGLLTDNSLLVQGDPDAIDELRSILRYIDVAPQQVSIKADIIEVNLNAVRAFGGTFNFFTNLANITANPGQAPGPNLTVDIVQGNLQAVIGAVVTNGKGRVLSSPLVTTMNNVPATIAKVFQTATFVPQTITSPAGITTVSIPVPINIQTTLDVLPRINRDGTITLQVTPQVSTPGETVTSPDGSVVFPTQSFTQTQITRRVRSGETIVIAGLTSQTVQDNVSKVPLLADIPVIGNLFRRVNRTTQESEMLIFLTPTIISEVGQGEAPTEQ
jgi:general secretion pathway protein D